jgi:hypothetical protein
MSDDGVSLAAKPVAAASFALIAKLLEHLEDSGAIPPREVARIIDAARDAIADTSEMKPIRRVLAEMRDGANDRA